VPCAHANVCLILRQNPDNHESHDVFRKVVVSLRVDGDLTAWFMMVIGTGRILLATAFLFVCF